MLARREDRIHGYDRKNRKRSEAGEGAEGEDAEAAMPPPESLLALRPPARVSAQVWNLPSVLPAARSEWRDPGCDEGELVRSIMTSDPIADMLTRVRNAIQARHPKVDVPASKLKAEIARILKEEGFITNYKVAEEGAKKTIKIYLKYTNGNTPVISAIERVSRPGCRVYVGQTKIPRVLGGMGINILTTPRGVMTGRDAHKEHLGGEVLCRVW
jgi:small subunit ribosomal protein S8